MLFRKIQQTIETYLKSGSNKVLIIDGARQVGKTFSIRQAGKALFPNFIEVNMLEDAIGGVCLNRCRLSVTFTFA